MKSCSLYGCCLGPLPVRRLQNLLARKFDICSQTINDQFGACFNIRFSIMTFSHCCIVKPDDGISCHGALRNNSKGAFVSTIPNNYSKINFTYKIISIIPWKQHRHEGKIQKPNKLLFQLTYIHTQIEAYEQIKDQNQNE